MIAAKVFVKSPDVFFFLFLSIGKIYANCGGEP